MNLGDKILVIHCKDASRKVNRQEGNSFATVLSNTGGKSELWCFGRSWGMSFITMFNFGLYHLYLFFCSLPCLRKPKERLLRLVLQDSNLFRASLAQKKNSSRSDELLSTLRTQSDRGKNSPRRDVHAELGAIKRELSNLVTFLERIGKKKH